MEVKMESVSSGDQEDNSMAPPASQPKAKKLGGSDAEEYDDQMVPSFNISELSLEFVGCCPPTLHSDFIEYFLLATAEFLAECEPKNWCNLELDVDSESDEEGNIVDSSEASDSVAGDFAAGSSVTRKNARASKVMKPKIPSWYKIASLMEKKIRNYEGLSEKAKSIMPKLTDFQAGHGFMKVWKQYHSSVSANQMKKFSTLLAGFITKLAYSKMGLEATPDEIRNCVGEYVYGLALKAAEESDLFKYVLILPFNVVLKKSYPFALYDNVKTEAVLHLIGNDDRRKGKKGKRAHSHAESVLEKYGKWIGIKTDIEPDAVDSDEEEVTVGSLKDRLLIKEEKSDKLDKKIETLKTQLAIAKKDKKKTLKSIEKLKAQKEIPEWIKIKTVVRKEIKNLRDCCSDEALKDDPAAESKKRLLTYTEKSIVGMGVALSAIIMRDKIKLDDSLNHLDKVLEALDRFCFFKKHENEDLSSLSEVGLEVLVGGRNRLQLIDVMTACKVCSPRIPKLV